jgi:hypothetical protein
MLPSIGATRRPHSQKSYALEERLAKPFGTRRAHARGRAKITSGTGTCPASIGTVEIDVLLPFPPDEQAKVYSPLQHVGRHGKYFLVTFCKRIVHCITELLT